MSYLSKSGSSSKIDGINYFKILFNRFEIEALAEAPDHCRRGTPASSVALQVQIDSIDPYLISEKTITAGGCVKQMTNIRQA